MDRLDARKRRKGSSKSEKISPSKKVKKEEPKSPKKLKLKDEKKSVENSRLAFKTCWKQSGKLWEAVESPEELLAQVAGIKEIQVTPAVKKEEVKEEDEYVWPKPVPCLRRSPPRSLVIKREEPAIKTEPGASTEPCETPVRSAVKTGGGMVWTADVRGKSFRVAAEDDKSARKAVAFEVLQEDHGITQVVYRYIRPKKKPRRVTPIHVLRELPGQEIFFRFVQHWTKGMAFLGRAY